MTAELPLELVLELKKAAKREQRKMVTIVERALRKELGIVAKDTDGD